MSDQEIHFWQGRMQLQHLFNLLPLALRSQRRVASASAQSHRTQVQRSSQGWLWDPSLASGLCSWTLRWGALMCVCRRWGLWLSPPTHRKGWIRIINWHPQRRCDSGHRCCVCAKPHIENLSCYFAAAAQIVQTVGAHTESAGLWLFVAII